MNRDEFIEEIEETGEETGKMVESLRERSRKAKRAKRKTMLRRIVVALTSRKAGPSKRRRRKRNLVPLLAVVSVVLLIFIPVIAFSGDEEEATVSEMAVLRTFQEGNLNYAYLVNGKKVLLDDVEVHFEAESADRTTICYSNEKDELVVFKNGKRINTGIREAKEIKVSFGGDTFLYYSDCGNTEYLNALLGVDSGTETGTLHLYNIKKKKDVVIANNVVVNSAALSPDGQTVAYVADYEDGEDYTGFYIVNGKRPVELGKGKRAFAVADKAEYIYYTEEDRIYAQKKKREGEKLADGIYSTRVLLNADCTELLYISDGKTYFTVNGGEKQKVSGKELDSMLVKSDRIIGFDTVASDGGTVSVTYTSVASLKEKLFFDRTEQDVVYLSDTLETESLASAVTNFAVSDDGEKLVYLDDGEVVKVTDFKDGGAKKDLTDEAEAKELYSGGNLKYMYYINSDAELFCIKGSKEKRMAGDVTSVMTSADGTYCYYVVEGEKLYYSKNGKKGSLLFEQEDAAITCRIEMGEVIAQVESGNRVTLYRISEKEIDMFRSYETEHPEEVLEWDLGL